MKALLISKLVEILLSMLSPDMLKKAIDYLLDIVEDAVEKSDSTLDDKIVIPLCNMIREALNVPDDD